MKYLEQLDQKSQIKIFLFWIKSKMLHVIYTYSKQMFRAFLS